MSLAPIAANPALSATPLQGDAPEKERQQSGEGFLGTLMDIVNPLQHIPGISTLYREATGDQLSGFANIIGGGLFGGPIGAAASVVNEIVTAQTGTDIGGNVMAQAETLASSATDPYAAAAPVLMPLQPDNGTSALVIALTGTEQISAQSTQEVVNAPVSPETAKALHSLERYRDPTLGLKDAPKQQQYRMQLEKIATDMKA